MQNVRIRGAGHFRKTTPPRFGYPCAPHLSVDFCKRVLGIRESELPGTKRTRFKMTLTSPAGEKRGDRSAAILENLRAAVNPVSEMIAPCIIPIPFVFFRRRVGRGKERMRLDASNPASEYIKRYQMVPDPLSVCGKRSGSALSLDGADFSGGAKSGTGVGEWVLVDDSRAAENPKLTDCIPWYLRIIAEPIAGSASFYSGFGNRASYPPSIPCSAKL